MKAKRLIVIFCLNGSQQRALFAIVLSLVASLLVGGCDQSHKTPKLTDSAPGSDTAKKSASYPPPKLPAPPTPASVAVGTPEERAVKFSDLLASGETRLSGWWGYMTPCGFQFWGRTARRSAAPVTTRLAPAFGRCGTLPGRICLSGHSAKWCRTSADCGPSRSRRQGLWRSASQRSQSSSAEQ